MMVKSFFSAQIQVPIQNNSLECGNNGWLGNGKHGQGTHSTKMGVDKSAENNPNASKCICPVCLSKPKNWSPLFLAAGQPCICDAITSV